MSNHPQKSGSLCSGIGGSLYSGIGGSLYPGIGGSLYPGILTNGAPENVTENGWTFWKFLDENGIERKLNELRKS